MKRIVLIDLDLICINSLTDSKQIIVDTLIVSTDEQVKFCKSDYKNIENILSMESINSFYLEQKINLDYEKIELFRATQLKVEHFLSRLTTDINAIQYIYYSAISYWLDKIDSNKIDAVFSAGIEFGSTFDSVIYDVAKFLNKKVFIMEVGLNNGEKVCNQLFDYTKKEHIKIRDIDKDLPKMNINDFLFNSVVKKNLNKKIDSFRDLVFVVIEKYFGYLGIMFILSVLRRFKSIHHSFNVSFFTYFKNLIYAEKLKKYYESKCDYFNKDKNYIYYSLHMEPEASTLARTIFFNQLVIIKTLSQSLPDGWELYVKEHPHQFNNLNNANRYFYLASLEKFKTKRYYDEIKNLSNVKLISMSVNSNELITNSRAIATINGTVLIEAVNKKKPILLFSQNTTPFKYVSGINEIADLTECKLKINKIYSENEVSYDNFNEIINDYFFEINKNGNYKNLIEKLIVGS